MNSSNLKDNSITSKELTLLILGWLLGLLGPIIVDAIKKAMFSE